MIRYEAQDNAPMRDMILGIGVFDGVHLGHRRIIAEVVDMARRTGALPAAVTFFPHPREVLCPDSPPRLLLPPEERLRRLRKAGAAVVGIIDFSAAVAATEPADFVDRILAGPRHIRGICVGVNWRFGKNGVGDTRFLADALARRGVAFRAVPELAMDGMIVSSSAIRDAISAGELAGAEHMMGAPAALYGEVVPGFHEATELLDAPTANLRVDHGVLPPNGVYATWAVVDGKRLPAITNIGISPTFDRDERERRVETHLLSGFSGDLYRRKLTVELKRKLRDETRFPSPAALKRQIAADCANALQILTGGDGR